MILCVGPTPALQRVMVFRGLGLNTVNRAAETLDGIAGKSINVAKVLKALGEEPLAIGFVGGERGGELQEALEARGIQTDFLVVPQATRQCITIIDQSGKTQTELVEESRPVALESYDKLLQIIRSRMSGCKAVVMSGTLTPGGNTDFYFEAARIAEHHGALAVVDAHGPLLIEALKARPDLVKPNRTELEGTAGRKLTDEAALLNAMRELLERGAKNVVVTAGKSPTLAFDGKNGWRILNPQIEVVNPIGSGDAFTAGLVHRLMRGDDLGEACRWGAACAAANALNLMAGEVQQADVKRLRKEVVAERLTSAVRV